MVRPALEELPVPISVPPSRAGSLSLLGGRLCLDFANTSSGRGTVELQDHLREYRDLLAWCRHAGVIGDAARDTLEERAAKAPAAAADALRRAVVWREALYRTLLALDGGTPPDAGDMGVINREFQRAGGHAVLRPADGACTVGWGEAEAGLDRVLWPIVWSAFELLQSRGDITRVRRCEAANCGWLFYDASKNRTRRWCTMKDCGNRAKARRNYLRRRLAAGGGDAAF